MIRRGWKDVEGNTREGTPGTTTKTFVVVDDLGQGCQRGSSVNDKVRIERGVGERDPRRCSPRGGRREPARLGRSEGGGAQTTAALDTTSGPRILRPGAAQYHLQV